MLEGSSIHCLTYSGIPEGSDSNTMANNEFVYIKGTKVYLIMEAVFPEYDPYEMFERKIKNLPEDGVSMLIFHPGYLDDFLINTSSLLIPRAKEVKMLTDSKWPKLLEESITCIDYRDL